MLLTLKNKAYFLILIILLCTVFSIFSQSAEIGTIQVEHTEDAVFFHVFDMQVNGMKNKQIHVEFWLSQNGEWITDSQIRLDPFVIQWDNNEWQGEAFWFCYQYRDFQFMGDPYQPYWGSFFIVDTEKYQSLLQADVNFNLPGGQIDEDTETDSEIAEDLDFLTSSLKWYSLNRQWQNDFCIEKNDYFTSIEERDTFQPVRGRAEDNDGYIFLWDTDFEEFYSDLYGYLYQQNAERLEYVKKDLVAFRDKYSLGYEEFATFIIACIQHTTYLIPKKLFGIYTPLEVIITRTGDCDSRSVLLYTLLIDFGYDVVVFYSEYYQHVMLGIANINYGNDYLKYNAIKYYFVETTATGWEIGYLPPEWSNKRQWVVIIPLQR